MTINVDPDGAHRRAAGYSLGMRQRLGLALALLGEPKLLILDEPTNGLDPAGIHEMRQLIKNLSQEHGVTIFLSSHLLSEVEQLADHLGIVQHGRLSFQGTLAELQAQRQTFLTLGLDQPDEAARVLEAAGFEIAGANGRLHITSSDPSKPLQPSSISDLNTLLVQRGFRVHHLNLDQPTLESLFLGITEG